MPRIRARKRNSRGWRVIQNRRWARRWRRTKVVGILCEVEGGWWKVEGAWGFVGGWCLDWWMAFSIVCRYIYLDLLQRFKKLDCHKYLCSTRSYPTYGFWFVFFELCALVLQVCITYLVTRLIRVWQHVNHPITRQNIIISLPHPLLHFSPIYFSNWNSLSEWLTQVRTSSKYRIPPLWSRIRSTWSTKNHGLWVRRSHSPRMLYILACSFPSTLSPSSVERSLGNNYIRDRQRVLLQIEFK